MTLVSAHLHAMECPTCGLEFYMFRTGGELDLHQHGMACPRCAFQGTSGRLNQMSAGAESHSHAVIA